MFFVLRDFREDIQARPECGSTLYLVHFDVPNDRTRGPRTSVCRAKHLIDKLKFSLLRCTAPPLCPPSGGPCQSAKASRGRLTF